MTARLVLDASAALHVVNRTQQSLKLVQHLKAAKVILAPHLFCSEVANGLWKYVQFGDLIVEQATAKLEESLSLIDSFEQDEQLMVEALTLAAEQKHPAYDCIYLVLARRFSAKLLTMDKKMALIAKRIGIAVF